MSSELQLVDPGQFNYEENVKSILSSTEKHMSIKDVRTELTYQQNVLEPAEDYSLDDIETAVEEVVNNVIKPQHERGELELSRQPVIYQIEEMPAEIEDTETRYKII